MDIRLGSVVTEVRYTPPQPLSASASGVESTPSEEESGVQITLDDGTTINGDAVLMTAPLGVLKKSMPFSLEWVLGVVLC